MGNPGDLHDTRDHPGGGRCAPRDTEWSGMPDALGELPQGVCLSLGLLLGLDWMLHATGGHTGECQRRNRQDSREGG